MTETIIKTPQNEVGEKPVVPYRPEGALAGLHGEFTADDIQVPFLRIIQAVGKSAADHPKNHGDLLYGSDTLIPKPASLLIYGVSKSYVQNTPFDANSAERPRTFRTIEEVEAAGGNTDRFVRAEEDSNNYVPQAMATVILEAPQGPRGWAAKVDAVVKYEEGKKLLAPAYWALRGTTYRIVVPMLRTIASVLEREGKELCHARFTLDTKLTAVGGNWIHTPILKRQDEQNSDEFVAFCHQIFGE